MQLQRDSFGHKSEAKPSSSQRREIPSPQLASCPRDTDSQAYSGSFQVPGPQRRSFDATVRVPPVSPEKLQVDLSSMQNYTSQ